MEKEHNYGKMEPNMKENGKITEQTVRESFIIQMGIFMKESLLMIEQTDLEHIIIKMVLNMLDNGKMI
jgi:hypothetical protein